MNSKATRTIVISAIVAMLALVTVTLVHAHSSRATQQAAYSQYDEDHHGMSHEECEEFMEERTLGDEEYDGRHGMIHEETGEFNNSIHGCR